MSESAYHLDIVDQLGNLIADHYSGDSKDTMGNPLATLLKAQEEILALRLRPQNAMIRADRQVYDELRGQLRELLSVQRKRAGMGIANPIPNGENPAPYERVDDGSVRPDWWARMQLRQRP